MIKPFNGPDGFRIEDGILQQERQPAFKRLTGRSGKPCSCTDQPLTGRIRRGPRRPETAVCSAAQRGGDAVRQCRLSTAA